MIDGWPDHLSRTNPGDRSHSSNYSVSQEVHGDHGGTSDDRTVTELKQARDVLLSDG